MNAVSFGLSGSLAPMTVPAGGGGVPLSCAGTGSLAAVFSAAGVLSLTKSGVSGTNDGLRACVYAKFAENDGNVIARGAPADSQA